ncbi:MAG TPA: hypothetical protein VF395_04325 [Polyangiaceae bacterium]
MPICRNAETSTTPRSVTLVKTPISQKSRVALRAANARKSSPKTSTVNARFRASSRLLERSAQANVPRVATVWMTPVNAIEAHS